MVGRLFPFRPGSNAGTREKMKKEKLPLKRGISKYLSFYFDTYTSLVVIYDMSKF